MNQFGVQFQRKIGKMGKKQCGQGDECRTCQKEQKGDAFARQAAGLADFAGEAAGECGGHGMLSDGSDGILCMPSEAVSGQER
ncbi:TPA: hypothetical protein ACMWWD_001389 [Neisseria gonorrhoeae]|uniref:hypothetical protein n=1 Tax=Neisseria gonorrhoeae TaxID=485 RepID=UPI001E517FC8|nr:hypothetical protein [Neisseria gonorrhoeae]